MCSTNLVAGALVLAGLVPAVALPNTAPGERIVSVTHNQPQREITFGGDDAYHSLDLGSLT